MGFRINLTSGFIRDTYKRKNPLPEFLNVLNDNKIKTGEDFTNFMKVIKKHYINKGTTNYEEIKKIWKENKKSVKAVNKGITTKDIKKELNNGI